MSADSRRKALRIADLASAVFDTGRRGAPKPGCDCVQCFGYCITDADKVMRDAHVNKSQIARGVPVDILHVPVETFRKTGSL